MTKYRKTKYRSRKISNAQNIDGEKYRNCWISNCKISNRKISKMQNIEIQDIEGAKYRKAKYRKKISKWQNIEVAKYRSGKISKNEISKWQNIECKISKWQNIERKISKWKNIESKISKWQNIESLADLPMSELELRGKNIVLLVTRRSDLHINLTFAGTGRRRGWCNPLQFFRNLFFVYWSNATNFSIAYRTYFLRPSWKFPDPDPLTFDLWRHNWDNVRRKMRSVAHNLQASSFLLVIWMWTCSPK